MMLSEKYRPQTIEDCVLSHISSYEAKLLMECETAKVLPNFLFYGSPGTGKTTVARVLCSRDRFSVRELNGSLADKVSIAGLETTLYTKSLLHKHRCVLIDEIDGVTTGGQNALRKMMEKNVQGISWIFTANDQKRIIPAIQSRMICMNFSAAESRERSAHIEGMMLRCERILSAEGIEYCDQAEIRKVVEWNYPDMRQILNQLQVRFGLVLAA